MLYFVARRLVSALSVVLVTLIATFTLFFVAPTDPAGGDLWRPQLHPAAVRRDQEQPAS